jgi:hypothetical protein
MMNDFEHFEKRANQAEDVVNKLMLRIESLEKERKAFENELTTLRQTIAISKGMTFFKPICFIFWLFETSLHLCYFFLLIRC